MNDLKLGIIGGMGPEASAYYYTQLIHRTKVSKDQDHFFTIVDSNAKIPDRTQAIVYGKESPLPLLIEAIERMNHAQIDQGFITCLTSHYFFDTLKENADFKLYNAIEETYLYLKKQNIKKVGLLATTGTINLKLFQKYFKDIELLLPNVNDQAFLVMDAIYNPSHGIKAGYTKGLCVDQLIEVGEKLIDLGAEAIIGGCTEISMVLEEDTFNVKMVDPMLVVIDHILKQG